MIKRLPELSTADKAFRELSGKLLHLAESNKLRHLSATHLEKLE
jgi:hypothetical protein